jgi:hypothetical protein
MFCVYYLYSQNGQYVILPQGPFASESAAQAWIAGQAIPQNYLVASAWIPTPLVPGGPLTPATLTVGQWVVAYIGINISGTYSVYLYGGFASQSAAQTYLNTLFPPISYAIGQVAAA